MAAFGDKPGTPTEGDDDSNGDAKVEFVSDETVEFLNSVVGQVRLDDESFLGYMKNMSLGDQQGAFLSAFDRRCEAEKVGQGDRMGILLKFCCFPGMDSLDEKVQLVSIQILEHVVDKSIPTELRWYGAPLYEFMTRILSSRKETVLEPSLRVAFQMSEKLENKLTLRTDLFRFVEGVIEYAIHATEDVSEVYAAGLFPFIVSMGVHTSKYVSKLLPWLLGMVSSGPIIGLAIDKPLERKVQVLKACKAIVQNCWPCLGTYRESILSATCRGALVTSNVAKTNSRKRELWAQYVDTVDILRTLDAAWYRGTCEHLIETLKGKEVNDKKHKFIGTLTLLLYKEKRREPASGSVGRLIIPHNEHAFA